MNITILDGEPITLSTQIVILQSTISYLKFECVPSSKFERKSWK
ncbi:hypothetical protein SLEP1_g624 [Rubroshorea leprosula]|uniref:Uncharacterized protein n=1 Tax=Rubroshorea leprosula TaxID=152421 RepID=A0AAV5HGS1_9ROSI|nr:hypothetical protein SLEP1_g624 [Rubroshorea leprosula]